MENRTIDRSELLEMLEALPDEAEFSLLVTGRSMEPYFLNRRTTVFLRKVSEYDPHIGDVVLFCREDGAFVLHRVYDVLPDGSLIINGDGQVWVERIQPAQVMACVTSFRRKEKGRVRQIDSFGGRFWKKFWHPLKPVHYFVAVCCYYWSRVPYKLGLKKAKTENKTENKTETSVD